MGPPFFTAEISRSAAFDARSFARFNGAAVLHGGDLHEFSILVAA